MLAWRDFLPANPHWAALTWRSIPAPHSPDAGVLRGWGPSGGWRLVGFRDEEWKPSFGLWRGRKHPFRVFQTSEVQSRAWRIFWREGWSNPGGDPALPTGPLSSILVTRFGCRPVMLTGGLLASAGMILASFASRLLEVYLTAGVLTGRLVDALKNYEIIFYLAGSEVALAGVFMAVATYCCLRCSKDTPSDPAAQGGASDTEDVEAEGDSEPMPASTEEPGSLEALEMLSPRAGSPGPEPEVEAVPGLAHESV
ncbi:monocarboxylate transporter 3 isoform X2 [Mesocricetus auratus]|uniref:Monocarboxylate transporter 3 isoform X2 n=1 Tax=Mesocricetus auratus TaxID=10036 RepID=A0ABM2Y5G2_MESAU|nr:monocarboxylate transporter 3 isoform X2 [Mesocricetus auratus]